jgi:hypothetical protein
MTRRTNAFEIVRRLALRLPGIEESTMYGLPALKAGGQLVACLAVHKSAEPRTLVVCVPIPEREDLVAADPATYYLTDHYVDSPSVLVRLDRIQEDALGDLLRMAHRFALSRPARRPGRTAGGRRRTPRPGASRTRAKR